ncbi:hypothetical protein KHA93_06025 [Bacillus sp. FJAT-49732]|uniref:YhfM-like domain-containing protein n=1 Tax=Lederbergia citrisecunda TaxID=2833583 RepID=A0A942TJB7_9BACI|nr:hypothetical protein [Lederbergia citrisecunda]MBS4199211.1 hypothetical protein [Lederbergia citrisecunda]
MKKIILFLSLLIVLLVTSGCLDEIIEQKITIQKRTGEENIFEDFKEVTKRKQVKKAIDIVKNATWKNEKVEMASYADYQFQFPSKNSNGSKGKIASYLLWISSNGENLEIVTDSDRYVKLTKQDSADLYDILTGEELIK